MIFETLSDEADSYVPDLLRPTTIAVRLPAYQVRALEVLARDQRLDVSTFLQLHLLDLTSAESPYLADKIPRISRRFSLSVRRRGVRRGGMTPVAVIGIVSQGVPIANVIGERVEVPDDKIQPHELLYKVGSPAPHEVGLRTGDLIVVEQRDDGHSATAELVMSAVDELVFIGRWWGKHQRRAVMDESLEPITEDSRLRVLGVVNVVMRPMSPLISLESSWRR